MRALQLSQGWLRCLLPLLTLTFAALSMPAVGDTLTAGNNLTINATINATSGDLTATAASITAKSSGSTVGIGLSTNGFMPSGVLPGGSSTSGAGAGTTFGTVSGNIVINAGAGGIQANLNRDAANANGAVTDDFDLTKYQTRLETQQIGAQLFGQAANYAAGTRIKGQGWRETDPQALALHAVIGLAEGAIAGGGSAGITIATGTGAAAGTYTSAALQQDLWQDYLHGGSIRPDTTEGEEILSLTSAAVGAGVAALTGAGTGNVGSAAIEGSSVSASSTLYNQEEPADEEAARPVGPDGEPLTDQQIIDEHEYYVADRALAALDPANSALETVTPLNYVPSERDVADINQALTNAQEIKRLNTTPEGLQTLIKDAPVGTSSIAEADQTALAQTEPNTETGGVTNPVPAFVVRVIPGDTLYPTLGPPGNSDVFVTSPDAIAGMTPAQISQALTIDPSDVFTIIEFSTPQSGIATPVFRADPGFVQGCLTAGGAPEFVIPNGQIPPGATITTVGPTK